MATKTIYASYAQSGTSSYNARYITIGRGSSGSKACLGFDLTCIRDASVNSIYLYLTKSSNGSDLQTIRVGASTSKAWGATVTPTTFSVQATNPSSNRTRRWDIKNSSLVSAIQGINGTAYLHLYEPGGEMQVQYEGIDTSTADVGPYIVVDYTSNASTFTLNKTSVDAGSTITMTITPSSSSYRHKAIWSLGSASSGGSTWIAAGTTSTTFTVPNAWMNQIPNSTSGAATVVLDTYNGDTKIGSASKSFTVTVPSSVVPTISSIMDIPVNGTVPSSWGVYVQGKSKATLLVTAAGAYGSTIASYVISGGGYTSTSASFTTGFLNVYGTVTFTATVTDSRGRTATATTSITVYPYSTPTFSSTDAYRCLQNGTADNSGTYARVKAVWTYSSVNGKNTSTCTVGYKQGESGTVVGATSLTSGTAATIGNGNLNVQNQYYAVFTLSDYFNSGITMQVSIPPSLAYALFIHRGGDAVGIGKYNNTANTVKSAWPMEVDGAITASGNMTGNNITANGWAWAKSHLYFGGNLQYYDEANNSYYTVFNPSTKRIDAEIVNSNTWLQAKTNLFFGNDLFGWDFTSNTGKKIADKTGKLWGTDITASGKITAATASLGAAPPEVINKSFWNDVYIAKLIRGLFMDLCVGSWSGTTSNTETDIVFANTGGHVMEGTPLVFVMQDSGTASGFRITNRSTTGFHIKANGVYTFGIQYLAIYLGFNTNAVT